MVRLIKEKMKKIYHFIKRCIIINTDLQARKWKNKQIESIEGYWKTRNDRSDVFIENKLKKIDFSNLLEIGCNCGNRLFNIAKKNEKIRFVGIDINDLAIEKGKEYYKKENIENVILRRMRVEGIGEYSNNSFDIVFSRATLIYIKPNRIIKILKNILRIAKKKIILIEMHGKDIKKDPKGTGVYCAPGNWKRDYIKLFIQLGIRKERIIYNSIPKNIWSPGGGGATYIEIEL